jgi:hypothetical protein
VDHRADVYSLGMVLYELLALRRPITAPTREGVLRQVITKALPPVSWLNRSVSRDLASVVHQATAKDPDDRYPSAIALAEDLGNVISKKPVVAKSYRYRFDEKEIAAERPREVIFVAFAFMLITMIAFWISLTVIWGSWGIRAYDDYGRILTMPIASISVLLALSSFISSCYILAGRKWARLMTAIICGIIGLCSLTYSAFGVLEMIAILRRDHSSAARYFWFMIPSLMILLIGSLSVILVPLLYRRGIQSSFDFSERLRSEHRQQSSALRGHRAQAPGENR